MSVGEDNSA